MGIVRQNGGRARALEGGGTRRSALRIAVLFTALALPVRVLAQTATGEVAPGTPPPPVRYAGLIPGLSTAREVRAALGEPVHEAAWYAWKMLYRPAAGSPDGFDAVYVRGRNGKLGTIEAVSIPRDLDGEARIVRRLGPPERIVRLATQSILDYASKGVRFAIDGNGRNIGVAYFPHGHRRVHAGRPRLLDLSRRPMAPAPGGTGAPPAGLRVGTAKVKLTPTDPQWLGPGGFRVHDDLLARIIVLRTDRLAVAVVAADLFGLSRSELAPIERALRSRGIHHLFLGMSHNHAAGDTIGIYGHYPEAYVRAIQGRILEGVDAARDRLRPAAEIRAAARELPLTGARVQGFFRNARNPGLLDPRVAVIRILGPDGGTLAAFVHFACHPEGIEAGVKAMGADFPGSMCGELERAFGGTVAFLNGALGGMVTGDTRARTHEEARRMGLGLARIAADLLRDARPMRARRFRVLRRRVQIPVTNPRFHAFAADSDRRPLVRGRLETEVILLLLGDAELLGIPGELLPELGWAIETGMAGFPPLVVGLVNDEIGYIIPAEDWRPHAYEESMSVGPAAGPLIRLAARELLEEATRAMPRVGPASSSKNSP